MSAWQITPMLGLYVATACATLLASVMTWRNRSRLGTIHVPLMTLASTVWTAGYALGFFHTGLEWKLVMLRVEFFGLTATAFLWVAFAGMYTLGERLSARALALLALIPALTFLQVLFVDRHHLFYRSFALIADNGLVVSSKEYGPGFMVWTIWGFAAVAGGYLLLIQRLLAGWTRRRSLGVILVVVLFCYVAAGILYLAGANPMAPYDPLPLLGPLAMLVMLLALQLHRFLDAMPVAHHVVFQNLHAGVLVADAANRLIELNPIAQEWLGPGETMVGRQVVDLLPLWKPLAEGEVQGVQEISLDSSRGPRACEMQTTPILGRRKQRLGFAIVLYDISRRRQLESAREQLIEELKEALSEIKTLSGLLPICANCKRIRDGDGTWNQLELYLRKHSDANFSHGICPDCVRTHYADVIGE